MGFQFWLKRREWGQIPDSSDRERKSSIIMVSHCLKCSLPGFDPSPGLILCNRSTDNEKLCTNSNYRPDDFCHNWLHCGQSCFPLLALMGNQHFVLITSILHNSYSSFLVLHVKSARPHSEHHFPAPSFKLCQIWLRCWRGTLYLCTAVHRRGQCPLQGLGTDKTVEAP